MTTKEQRRDYSRKYRRERGDQINAQRTEITLCRD